MNKQNRSLPQFGISVDSRLFTTGKDGDGGVLTAQKNDFGISYWDSLDIGFNLSHNFHLGLGYRGIFGLVDIREDAGSVINESYYILDALSSIPVPFKLDSHSYYRSDHTQGNTRT